MERGALGILHELKKFHHYFFIREVSIITDHKPLVSIFKKDVATLLQRQSYNKCKKKSHKACYGKGHITIVKVITEIGLQKSIGSRTSQRERDQPNDNHIRIQYGKLIKKPERLSYN